MKHSSPRQPKRRAVRLGLVLTPVLAVAVGTSVIWQTSSAAFSATTSSGVNNWQTGGVSLTDDDGTSGVMFTATGLKPGSTGERCITVTASGSLPAAIRLYGSGLAQTNSLATYIDLVVTKGTGGSFGSCTDFSQDASSPGVFTGSLATFGSTTDYANGYPTWTTAGGSPENRTFRFTYTLDANAPTTTENSSASITFTWETQNS